MAEVRIYLGRGVAAPPGDNPCDGCSAPCCRLMIVPQEAPRTAEALDLIRFLLVHEDTHVLLDEEGAWLLSTYKPCRYLTPENRCGVHRTDAQPTVCATYDPRECWYKRNFHDTDEPVDVIRMDLAGFDRLVARLSFDESGNVTGIPTYDEARRLAAPPGPGPTL